jgi:hypothetical protein
MRWFVQCMFTETFQQLRAKDPSIHAIILVSATTVT